MDRWERVERPVLYLLVFVLTTAVGWLVFKPAGTTDDDLGPMVADAMATSLAEFKQEVAADVENRVGTMLSDHRDLATQVAREVARIDEDDFASLEARIVDAVANKLLAAGFTLTGTGECPETPCPPGVLVDSDDSPWKTLPSRFPLFYKNARLNEDRQVTADSLGIKPALRHLDLLELLSKAFQPCHRADAPVEFAVTGYASTAEFRVQTTGEPMPESDELNLTTANLRAQIIGDYLQTQGFNVETKQWSELDLERPYLDDDQLGPDQQALNRTVFVDLKSAGACELAR